MMNIYAEYCRDGEAVAAATANVSRDGTSVVAAAVGHVGHGGHGGHAKAVARMLTIYIEEAHAADEWKLPESLVETEMGVSVPVHQSIADRIAAAKLFRAQRNVPSLEIVCDSMRGDMVSRYGAWPERLYVIVDGVVVYQGGLGPFDYKLWEVQEWLAERYGVRGASLRK